MARIQSLFFLSIFFFLQWNNSEACSCLPVHPQAAYCGSDFVIQAVPVKKSNGTDEFSVVFTIKIITVYKANGKGKAALKSNKIYTASNSAACGVELQLNRRYLLSGGVSNNRANINLCGYNRLWRDVSQYERQGIETTWKDACVCRIEYCFDSCNSTATDLCQLNFSDNGFCYISYSSCLPNAEQKCLWDQTSALTDCLNQP